MKKRSFKTIYALILAIVLMSQTAVNAAGASSPTLLYLTANPSILSLTEGNSASVIVSGYYTDGSVKKLTNCIWTSSDTSVASVSKGKIKGVSEGSATVSARMGSISVDIKVTVNSASSVKLLYLSASADNVSLKKGSSQTITVTGTYSDGSSEKVTSKCNWTTSDAAVASVSKGKITGFDSGNAVITASIGSINLLIEVEVYSPGVWITSWKPSADTVTVAPGKTKTITINANYSDNSKKNITSQFVWTSDDPSVATVSKGKITGVASGVTYVTARNGLKAVAIKVTVSGPPELMYLSVSPEYVTIAEGRSQSVIVTGTYSDDSKKNLTSKCTWTSGSPATASVSGGKITGISVGRALVRAEYESKTVNVPVTVTFSDLLYLSASVDSLSLAPGKSKTVTINCIYGDNTKKKITSECTWTSSDSSVATVLNGKITGISGGTAIITATYNSISVDIRVTVDDVPELLSLKARPGSVYVYKGEAQPITVSGIYSDGSEKNLTSSCKWKTDNDSVATVSRGVVKGKKIGTTTVYAEFDSQRVEVEVNVLRSTDSSVKLLSLSSLTSIALEKGKSVKMSINGIYSDGTSKSLEAECTWTSDNTRVAKVVDGRIFAVGDGIATISAFYGSKSVDIIVTVLSSSEVPFSISVSSSSVTVARGKTKSVSVYGEFEDGEKDISAACVWTSSNNSVATVINGDITGKSAGEAIITAVYGSRKVDIPVKVISSSSLKGLYSISSTSVRRGKSLDLVCFGVYSDGSREDITKDCQWSTSDASVVTVNKGRIVGMSPGTAVITAKSGSQSVKIKIEVRQR